MQLSTRCSGYAGACNTFALPILLWALSICTQNPNCTYLQKPLEDSCLHFTDG